MSATSWAWLVLLFPLLGSITIGLTFRKTSWRFAGIVGTQDSSRFVAPASSAFRVESSLDLL